MRHWVSRAGVPLRASMSVLGAEPTWPRRGSQRNQERCQRGAFLPLLQATGVPKQLLWKSPQHHNPSSIWQENLLHLSKDPYVPQTQSPAAPFPSKPINLNCPLTF